MKAHRVLLFAGSLALGSCGGSSATAPSVPPSSGPKPLPTPTPSAAFLIVRQETSILSYAVQDDGSLSLRSTSAAPRNLEILAVPTGRILLGFADVTTCCHSPRDTDLLTYEIAADGGVSLPDKIRLQLEDYPRIRAATSRSLYMQTYGRRHAAFYVLPIDGSKGERSFEAATVDFVTAMAVSPTERVFYAAGGKSEDYAIESYLLGPDGTGEFVQSVTLPSAAVQLAIHPSGRFVYAATLDNATPSPGTGQILIYGADGAGGLVQAGSVPAAIGALTPHPDGRFLYETRGNEIDLYAVDSGTGALTRLDRVTTTAVPSSTSRWTADPSGRFLYGTGAGQIWGYAIGTFGSLRFLGSVGTGQGDPIIVTPTTEH
jgi:6-phosphogluconolactonase (cycloisomerase 2 family)